jgi:hypothetical protein
MEILTSFIVLFIIFGLFYKATEPPVIVAALSFQWLSIAIGHFYLLFFNTTESDLLWHPTYSLDKIEETYWLSIIALLTFSLGLKIALINLKIQHINSRLVNNYDTFKIIILYLIFSIVFEPLAGFLRFKMPGLFQGLNTLTYFKWSLFFIMIYISFIKHEYKTLVFVIIAIEILLGFTGYFAEFKDFLLLFPIVYLSFNKIVSKRQILVIAVIAFLLVNVGAVWSYVKVQYRPFLSGGERAQVVKVSKQEALLKLWELSSGINSEKYALGFEALVKRIYFLEYFSATVNHIPYFKPYMEGENWSKSLQHIFMPRIFFPDKEAIDDSKQTFALTGIDVADASQGTSISTGYMAESYADFGPNGMHFAIFFLGLLLGLIYRAILSQSLNPLWGFALILPMFFLLNINGKSLIKIFGDTTYFFIIFWLLKRFAVPWLDNVIKYKTQ